ncbi:hypothetical protein TNIN_33551 [Trichonephila inaurata madagascariensis]|uniref:Uncharacterized protein n=1 Tax=Trichonephila inaurata madagascariensis TaxID=2747483 RepID=A0A8X6X6B4_9ARAC|nr:hypothetical protein TNIN_33551 [Trichonephila inaurata madagascariensis]
MPVGNCPHMAVPASSAQKDRKTFGPFRASPPTPQVPSQTFLTRQALQDSRDHQGHSARGVKTEDENLFGTVQVARYLPPWTSWLPQPTAGPFGLIQIEDEEEEIAPPCTMGERKNRMWCGE